MRRSSALVALVAAGTLLAACGSDSDSGSSGSPSASPSSSSTAPTSSPASVSKSAEASTSPAGSSSAPTAAVAPEGTSIKAGAEKRLPARVGEFVKDLGSGPATIYKTDGNLISLSFLSGSNYDLIVKNITKQKSAAGTGMCGSTSVTTNLTCYLRTDDGVLNISADATDVPLPTLIMFTNHVTVALGFS